MAMKKYSAYKDSGIEWIGEMPQEWECIPMKRGMIINNGKDYKDVQVESGYPVYGSGGRFAYASGFLHNGEALLLGRKGTIDKPMYVNEKFWTVDTMFYAVPNEKVHCKYMYYQALTIPFDLYSTNTALPSMTQSDLGNNPMCFPPLAEQQAIAAYLDHKVGQIDSAVSGINAQIADFKAYRQSVISEAVTKGLKPDVPMKDSGIEWIGEIPHHWEVSKLKSLCQIFGRIGFRGYNQTDLVSKGEGAITLSPSNFTDTGSLDYSKCSYLSWEKYNESPEIMVKNGDILFVKTASVGKYALVEDLPMEATLNPQIVVMKEIKCNAKYLTYSLGVPYIRSQIEKTAIGSTILTISQTKINNYNIILPPLAEQQAIAAYLDEKTAKIDDSIKALEAQVADLLALKQSTISEAVTGKVDVRDWKPSDN